MTQVTLLAQAQPNLDGLGNALMMIVVVAIALTVFLIACMWTIFSKAGEPGWAAIIPIYNTIVMCRVAGKPGWWVLLLFIPFVNLIIGIMVLAGLSEKFGYGTGMTIGLIFLPYIFLPVLAFSGQYEGGGRRRIRDDYDDDYDRRRDYGR
jgi:hypothetical protein